MMNPTMFNPIALDVWYSDENNDSLLQTELEHYLQNYFSCFSQQRQRRLLQTSIQGLLSPLERKSIEPIALHFSGEKYVRPLQQFFTVPLLMSSPFWIPTRSSCSGRLGQATVCYLWMTQAL